MPELTSTPPDELSLLKERTRKLAQDKSYLQLIINLMNKVNQAQGLDSMVEALLGNILDVIGGTNIMLYYMIDDAIFYADLMHTPQRLERIDDEQVQRVFELRKPLEVETDFGDTQMLTSEFSNAYTWVFPLLVGHDFIGAIKLENLHMGMRELYSKLPTFFTYVSSALKNEILGHTQLRQAYDRLSATNLELEQEIGERKQAEAELRQARDTLEEQVRKRTNDLHHANQLLQHELAERKRAQDELSRYAEEVQDLYDHAPCGYHSLDKDGMFMRVNDTELQWLGYQREELIGQKYFTDIVTPQDIETFRQHFPEFKRRGWVKDLEFELRRKDGSTLPVLLNATAVTDADGNFLMSRSTIFDITDRKKVQESEHLLSAIVESSDDAIISKDLNEIILTWNRGAERIYGYRADEAIGRNISLLVPQERLHELGEILTKLRRGVRIEHFTTERIRKDGQRICVSLTISPIRDASGTIVCASIISRDITEQARLADQLQIQHLHQEELIQQRTAELLERSRELQDNQKALMNIVDDLNQKTDELEEANTKLKELDQLKSMFIASMSHELRTPLNSIIGFSSIILDEWLGPVNPEQKENLATIKRSGKHLLSLINDVIDVSKIEAGRIETRIEEFDLYDLLTEAVQYIEKDAGDKNLELRIAIDHHLISSDRRRLLQCVINLLSNAVKFTETGSIGITTSTISHAHGTKNAPSTCLPASIDISVTDSGIGIPDEELANLFKPFVRLDSHLKTTVPGTGLGLYLTRKLVVEVLGGDILCTSKVGVGSTFSLKIPESLYEKGTGSRG